MDYIDQLYKSYYPELTLPLMMIAGILAELLPHIHMSKDSASGFVLMISVLLFFFPNNPILNLRKL